MDKIITINQNYEFRRVYSRGKYFTSPILVTYVFKNRLGICRIGITTSKKIGKAVRRNRARRIIKAAFGQVLPGIAGGWDIVFVARNQTVFSKSADIKRVMEGHLKAARILKPNNTT